MTQLAQSDTQAMSLKPLRFGIIGCGALGVVHARRLNELPNVRITAVSDPDAGAMQRVLDAVAEGGDGSGSHAPACTDYRDLLKIDDMDAVCISSPNPYHVEQILASVERGLDVLCEKPLSMVPGEVQQVVDATRAGGRTVAIAYQSRYRRDARLLRCALQSGKWGKVTSVSIFSSEDWISTNVGTWRHDPARCPGGFFVDANGHQLDVLFWLTGMEAAQVRATIERRGTPVPMVTWGEARLRPQGSATTGSSTPAVEGPPLIFTFVGDAKLWREEIAIQTEGADFLLRDTRLYWSDGKRALEPFPESEWDPAALDPAVTPDTSFVAALRGGPPVASPPETVWPVLRFTLAALASAANGNVMQPADAGV